jgi:hypothetical protein
MSGKSPLHSNILSLGAGRYSDRKILCKHLADSSFTGADKCRTYFINLMNANRADFGVATSIIWDVYMICYVIRQDVDVFCYAVCSVEYPLRIGIKLMDEFIAVFLMKYSTVKIAGVAKENELSKSAKPMMTTLADKYEDVGKIDSLQRAHSRLSDVKNTMSESIGVMVENTESAESIYHLARDVNEEAQIFKKNTNKLKMQLRCRTYKVMAIVCVFFCRF